MISRLVTPQLRRLAKQYPVVTVTGPRQAGKTTLCRATFPDKPYVSLEDPDKRRMAQEDPRGFLAAYPRGAILDEFHRVPELPSYLQRDVDDHPTGGRYILTGSHQFEVMERVSQSLAGRSALVRLLPFSYAECYGAERVPLDEVLFRGFFPRLFDQHLEPTEAMAFYVSTYVERDLRGILRVRDLATFERFLRLVAGSSGQLVNLSRLGNDVGADHKTIAAWLAVLESSYLLFRLPPHHANVRKRVVKSAKLYLLDVGLVCYLLGIEHPRQLATHPLRGALFETFVVGELLKRRYNAVRDSNLFFFRDQGGHEVDVLMDQAGQVSPLEIKSAQTMIPAHCEGLGYYRSINRRAGAGYVVYAGADVQKFGDDTFVPYERLTSMLDAGR